MKKRLAALLVRFWVSLNWSVMALDVASSWIADRLGVSGALGLHSTAAWAIGCRRRLWSLRFLALLLVPVVSLLTAWLVGRRPGVPVVFAVSSGLVVGYLLQVLCREVAAYRLVTGSSHVGSAPALRGDCAIFHVFVGNDWTPALRQRSLGRARKAWDWIEKAAAQHGVELRLNHGGETAYFLMDRPADAAELAHPEDWEPYQERDDSVRRTVERMLGQIKNEVERRMTRLATQPASCAVFAHLPGDVGFAYPATNSLWDNRRLEVCVCGRANRPPVFAHELLHLFGAPDLYFHPWRILTRPATDESWARRFEQQVARVAWELVRKVSPESIMSSTSENLSELRIDPITAAAVGWPVPFWELRKALRKWQSALDDALLKALLSGSEVQ